MKKETISKLRKIIREEYKKLNEDIQLMIQKEFPGAVVIDATKNKNVNPELRRKILSLPKRSFTAYGPSSASTEFAHIYTFTDREGKFTFNKNKPVILYIPVNSESKIKVQSEGKYKVTWTDRNYKKREKVFMDDPNGAPENGLIKAKKFKDKLDADDKKSPHGLYRSIDLSIEESKIKKESITGEVIFSVQAKDNSVVKVTELPNGVIYVYKDGQKTNWKAVQGLVNPKDRKEIGDYILKGK